MQVHPGTAATRMATMTVEAPLPAPLYDSCASASVARTLAGMQLSPQQWQFLSNWRDVVHPKLAQLLSLLGSQEVARNLAVVQVRGRAALLPRLHERCCHRLSMSWSDASAASALPCSLPARCRVALPSAAPARPAARPPPVGSRPRTWASLACPPPWHGICCSTG
jgi:hypothetical protein